MRISNEENLALQLGFEQQFLKEDYKYIAGADEVGRGPLAGPVVSACLIMPRHEFIMGIKDSKKITEKKREILHDEIAKRLICSGVGVVDNNVIDEINILNATRKAFNIGVNNLEIKPDILLMDYITGLDFDFPFEAIVKGDDKSYVIGCASIFAKVIRDKMMIDFDKIYPEYHFASNKGYGTKEHIEAIKKHGPCPIHRKSFIKRFV